MRNRFLVIQIDMAKHPRVGSYPNHTGDGVLLPVTCDGHYSVLEEAQGVADYLSEKHPGLRTYVVQVISDSTVEPI